MEDFIKTCKLLIEENNLPALQDYYLENKDEPFAWEYAYQKIYLHACLKKKREIAEWMKDLFPTFDPIQQIALRQMFSYGKYLLAK
jgi:hypothetical protein